MTLGLVSTAWNIARTDLIIFFKGAKLLTLKINKTNKQKVRNVIRKKWIELYLQ